MATPVVPEPSGPVAALVPPWHGDVVAIVPPPAEPRGVLVVGRAGERLERYLHRLSAYDVTVDVVRDDAVDDSATSTTAPRTLLGVASLVPELLQRGSTYRLAILLDHHDRRYLPAIRALAVRAHVLADVHADSIDAHVVDGLVALDEEEATRAARQGVVVTSLGCAVDSYEEINVQGEMTRPAIAGVPLVQTVPPTPVVRGRVLVLGIFVSHVPNFAPELTRAFASSREWMVDQRWVALGTGEIATHVDPVTVFRETNRVSKFTLLNRLLAGVNIDTYDFVVVADDDVELPDGFLDRYLELAGRHSLALSQPARTHDSYIDHHFVAALNGVDARRTTFVEIGPVFAIARAAYPVILPFDEAAPMGWGLDSVWPVMCASAGLSLGIVDATPVRHALRKPVTLYDHSETSRAHADYLRTRPHLPLKEAFSTLEVYSAAPPPRAAASA